MNIVIVSPHRDDAAFSLALAIRGWLTASHRVTVLGVFTRSLFAPYSDAETVHPNDLLSYVSAMRRREDAEFLKLLPGLRMVDLNLKDAPLRLRCSADEVYTLPFSPEDAAIAKIQKAVGKLAAAETVDAIVLPLALGHHVDHVVVRNAALGFANDRACAFYEDLPDAISADFTEAQVHAEHSAMRELHAFDQPLHPVTLQGRGDRDAAVKIKRRIVSVYGSQVDDATIDAISDFGLRYGGGERVWANPAWLTAGL